ncbi:MAG: hypothetical protein IJO04_01425 [Oscillospiraceae bacterium]|nr:hypothetical protein [Oscillospiraceae bacterium]
MRIQTQLSCNEYTDALKERLGSFTDFGCERFTGFVFWRFFSITHHAGHEYNRRITNERNSAVGYVKKTPEGAQVRCVRLKGWTTPQAILLSFLIGILICPLASRFSLSLELTLMMAIGFTVFMALITAASDSMTENGEWGAKEIYALIVDPTDPFAYLKKH